MVSDASEFVRCKGEIRMLIFGFFLFFIALVLVITIPTTELDIIFNNKKDEVINVEMSKQKLVGAGLLLFFAVLFFIAAIVFSTKKGCYKTSIFGLLLGLITGIL